MTEEKKENYGSIFQRCPVDLEHPYSLIKKDLIRNTTLSWNCTMLLIYLLSYSENSETLPLSEIFSLTKEKLSDHVINKLLNEAIEAGYIRKYLKFNRFHYEISDSPIFKDINF